MIYDITAMSPLSLVPISYALATSLTNIIPRGSFSEPKPLTRSSTISFKEESDTIVSTFVLVSYSGVTVLTLHPSLSNFLPLYTTCTLNFGYGYTSYFMLSENVCYLGKILRNYKNIQFLHKSNVTLIHKCYVTALAELEPLKSHLFLFKRYLVPNLQRQLFRH